MPNESSDNAQTVRIGAAPHSGVPTEREPVWDPFYESVGGHAGFKKLVDEFYRLVETDEVLRPMYPEGDLAPAAHRLTMFLEQYWGGPTTYQEERGHPRLRMRHAAFKIGPLARDRWISHMRSALDTLGLPPLIEAELWAYLDRAAHSLLNSFED
ncbi:MAG: hypothetical protein RL508_808 [Actinomycetota bacterium]